MRMIWPTYQGVEVRVMEEVEAVARVTGTEAEE